MWTRVAEGYNSGMGEDPSLVARSLGRGGETLGVGGNDGELLLPVWLSDTVPSLPLTLLGEAPSSHLADVAPGVGDPPSIDWLVGRLGLPGRYCADPVCMRWGGSVVTTASWSPSCLGGPRTTHVIGSEGRSTGSNRPSIATL